MAIHFAGIGYGLDPESCKASNHGHRSKTGQAKAEEKGRLLMALIIWLALVS